MYSVLLPRRRLGSGRSSPPLRGVVMAGVVLPGVVEPPGKVVPPGFVVPQEKVGNVRVMGGPRVEPGIGGSVVSAGAHW